MKKVLLLVILSIVSVFLASRGASACGPCAVGIFNQTLPPWTYWCILPSIWLLAIGAVTEIGGGKKYGFPGLIQAFAALAGVAFVAAVMPGPYAFLLLIFILPFSVIGNILTKKPPEALARRLMIITFIGIFATVGLYSYSVSFRKTRAYVDYMKTKGEGRNTAQGKVNGCKSNCKNIAASLESYANDHDGHFPPSMAELSPSYLKTIPTCPSDRRDTYSGSYLVSEMGTGYTFYCAGENHGYIGYSPNYPQYNSVDGQVTP